MITHTLVQGSPEWHQHRRQYFNASDAPAMMGCSPYKTRTQLLHEMHTGVTPNVNAATQRRFDDGHRFEALARPLAEEIIGEDLFPVTGTSGKLSASFDGLTMDESTAFEHKTMNAELHALLIDDCLGSELPMQYRVQMEHQCMVSGSSRVLFMASKWDGDTLVEERHCWYTADADLLAAIGAAWNQFQQDLIAYVPTEVAPVIVAAAITALPAVSVQVTGSISIKDNFSAFEVALKDFIEHRLIRQPETDQDFADLDTQIKALKGAESALDALEAQMLSQVEAVDMAKRTKDMLLKMARDNRLMAEKLLTARKDQIKVEQVQRGQKALAEHVATLNARLGKPYMPMVTGDFAAAIKGLRTVESLKNAVDTLLAILKISSSATADLIQANLTTLKVLASEHAFLFSDTATIVLKANDDLTALVKTRIADHQAAELAKEEATRVRIQAEEKAKAEAAARLVVAQELEAAAQAREVVNAAIAEAAKPAPAQAAVAATSANVVPMTRTPITPQESATRILAARLPEARPSTPPTLRLGQIGERLGFALTGDFLKTLGFEPAARDKSALLFHEASFTHICAALVTHINQIEARQAA